MNQTDYLSILTNTPADQLKSFVDTLLPQIGNVDVLQNRTGLVMVPYTDSVHGAVFHLGEVLVAEARVRIGPQEGYGAVMGRDLLQALAVAIVDAMLQADLCTEPIMDFLQKEAKQQAETENLLLRQVEATRVEMETF